MCLGAARLHCLGGVYVVSLGRKPASALRIGMHDIFAPEGVFVLFDFAELTVRFKK